MTKAMCNDVAIGDTKVHKFTSTWLSVNIKAINFADFLPHDNQLPPPDTPLHPATHHVEPRCEEVPVSLRTLDHLSGMLARRHLRYISEVALKDPFLALAKGETSVERLALKITAALAYDRDSWVLSTAASLFWRLRGDSYQAVTCLRHALYHAPSSMRDVPLNSLANVFHRSGLYNDAIIVANLALEISPDMVINHFTMATIYESKGEISVAKTFYLVRNC